MNDQIYQRKVWLTHNDHSSSFVMCYYNPNCLNNRTQFFIRFGDCEQIVTLYENPRRKKKVINDIDNILAVLKGKRRSYTYRNSYRIYKFMQIIDEPHEKSFEIFESALKPLNGLKPQPVTHLSYMDRFTEVLRIHKDKNTCSEEIWQNKLAILINELEQFKYFLLGLVG